MDIVVLKQNLTRRMEGAIEILKKEFAGLRTGRISPALLEPVRVEAYGSLIPLPQVGTISILEPRLLTVQVWDRSLVNAVVTAVRDSGLGLNPMADGQLVRVPLPQLTEERRKELIKAAARYAEGAKVAVRGVRRDGMEQVRQLEKKREIGEDEAKVRSEEIQILTDIYIKKIDKFFEEKEIDIKIV